MDPHLLSVSLYFESPFTLSGFDIPLCPLICRRIYFCGFSATVFDRVKTFRTDDVLDFTGVRSAISFFTREIRATRQHSVPFIHCLRNGIPFQSGRETPRCPFRVPFSLSFFRATLTWIFVVQCICHIHRTDTAVFLADEGWFPGTFPRFMQFHHLLRSFDIVLSYDFFPENKSSIR
jgi:hypothetical protein